MGRNSRIKEKSVGPLEYSKEEICRNKKKPHTKYADTK